MTENGNSKDNEVIQQDNWDIGSALKKMQVQLDSMEKKIDSLVQQSKPRTFRDKSFSMPNRDYVKTRRPSERRYEGKKEGVSSEGKFYHGRPFGKKKDGGKNSLKRGKKFFDKSSK